MRVAICISGQFRVFPTALGLFRQNVLNPLAGHEFDVYIHTWDVNVPTERQLPVTRHTAEEVVGAYAPSKMIIESQKTFDISKLSTKIIQPTKIQTVMSMYYSIYRSIELASLSGKKYDAIVRCRTDSMFFEPVIITGYDGIALDWVHIIGDQFAFSSMENMSTYALVYENFYKLFDKCQHGIPGDQHAFPEAFVTENAMLYGLPITDYARTKMEPYQRRCYSLGRSETDCQFKVSEYASRKRD